jgi:hypothetical protein
LLMSILVIAEVKWRNLTLPIADTHSFQTSHLANVSGRNGQLNGFVDDFPQKFIRKHVFQRQAKEVW